MYVDFDFYKEGLVNLTRKGAEGEQQIKVMMENFRTHPPHTLGGLKVVRALDYQSRQEKNLMRGIISAIPLPASDVLQFYCEDGSKISVRPSGTEPKIKFYISVKTKLQSKGDFNKMNQQLDGKIKAIENDIIQ
jgi:phosphoglucomutase